MPMCPGKHQAGINIEKPNNVSGAFRRDGGQEMYQITGTGLPPPVFGWERYVCLLFIFLFNGKIPFLQNDGCKTRRPPIYSSVPESACTQ